jgi:hypothetical protein
MTCSLGRGDSTGVSNIQPLTKIVISGKLLVEMLLLLHITLLLFLCAAVLTGKHSLIAKEHDRPADDVVEGAAFAVLVDNLAKPVDLQSEVLCNILKVKQPVALPDVLEELELEEEGR